MKGIVRQIVIATMALMGVFGASAADFFDTSEPQQAFNIGVRVGVNTSNRTIRKDVFNLWNHNSWGTGFDAGVVADINIRNYIAIQPGLFYQSRSGNHTYITSLPTDTRISTVGSEFVQVGHTRRYSFNIPILCSVRFNISDDVRWSVDLGPYMAFTLKNSVDKAYWQPDRFSSDMQELKSRNFDFGAKMGMGLNIKQHYYIGIHYLAGGLHPWKESALEGRNKAWSFTAGYDF